jgi:hypothetical protein
MFNSQIAAQKCICWASASQTRRATPKFELVRGLRGRGRKSYVVTEFEVLSIRQHSVGLRFRLKRFDRLLNADQAMHILEADKVSWHTINYVLGKRVSIPMENGQPVLRSGSVVD